MADETEEEAMLAQVEADLAAGRASEPVAEDPPIQAAPETTPETTPEPEKPAEGAPQASEDAEPGPPRRVRIETLPDGDRYKVAAATNLAKAEGISFGEAWGRISPPDASAEPEPEKPDPVTTLESELADVRKILDGAAEDQSLLTPEIVAAFRRERELLDSIRDEKASAASAQAQQTQNEQQKFDSEWESSEKLVSAMYPDALVENSALNKAVAAELETISKDPNHRDYGRSDLPEVLFTKHAARLGIAPKKIEGGALPSTKGVLPASGGAKTTPAPVVNPATQQAAFQQRQAKAVEEGDDEELYALAEEELTGQRPSRRPQMSIR